MSTNGLVSLDLGRRDGRDKAEAAAETGAIRRILGEAVAVVAVLIDSGEPANTDAASAVGACRAGVTAGLQAVALDPLATECFEASRRHAGQARGRAADQRAQVAALVGMVQEAVAAIAGSQTSLDKTLTGSASRFERLARIDNVREIQAQLVNEVTMLKRIAIERRASWDKTFQDFGHRLSGLETQLDLTSREAAIDPLTNIANRRTFERTCREWMAPDGQRFVIAMADVDDFKAINDRHGHAVGDRVLVMVAETLSRCLRGGDVVARLGGDEFAILAAAITLQQAQGRFAAIVSAVGAACRPIMPDGTTPSLSMGMTEFSAGDTPASLQKRADMALYEAKRGGKGRLVSRQLPFTRDLLKRS